MAAMEEINIRHGIAHAYSVYMFPLGRIVRIDSPKMANTIDNRMPNDSIAKEVFITNGRVCLPFVARAAVKGNNTVISEACINPAMSENLVAI